MSKHVAGKTVSSCAAPRTEAVRALEPFVERIGYREYPGCFPPLDMLIAAVEQTRIVELLSALVEPLGDAPAVLVGSVAGEFWRDCIDMPVLRSILWEHEAALARDGFVSLHAWNDAAEVALDSHKLLVVYALDLDPFRAILAEAGIPQDAQLPLVCDFSHLHLSDDADAPDALRLALGCELEWRNR
jgi:hypothetical protein